LNFACGKNASQNENARGCNAAFFARRCGIDRAALQQVTEKKRKIHQFSVIFRPTVEKAHPTVEKAQA
jgi:hypothetical protein